MSVYRLKAPVEAWQWTGSGASDAPSWVGDYDLRGWPIQEVEASRSLTVPTNAGLVIARAGDWLIRGPRGEVSVCKPDIFEATYELV